MSMYPAERYRRRKPGLHPSRSPRARHLALLLLPWLALTLSAGGKHSCSCIPSCPATDREGRIPVAAADDFSDGGRCLACMWQLASQTYAAHGLSSFSPLSLAPLVLPLAFPPLLLIEAAFDARAPPHS